MGNAYSELGVACACKERNKKLKKLESFDCKPEKMLATAAMMKLKTTPGPAMFLATIPATKYLRRQIFKQSTRRSTVKAHIPVPQHDPTPKDVRSNVVKHF